MALCICCRFNHTNVQQELVQGRIASRMNLLALLLTPASLCSAAYLNSGVSASWWKHAGSFCLSISSLHEALILVSIPQIANI